MQRRGMERSPRHATTAGRRPAGGDHVYITPTTCSTVTNQAGATTTRSWPLRHGAAAGVCGGTGGGGRPDAEPLADDLLAVYLRTSDAQMTYLPGALDCWTRCAAGSPWVADNGNTTPQEAGLSATST
jgi:hypothetical protein